MIKKAQILAVIFLFIGLFAILDQQTSISSSFLKFRPKEYDLTLTTQAKNCEIVDPLEGLCQGGNWAQVFSQGLYLTKCLSSSTKQPLLSAEELLQCATFDGDKCSQGPNDLSIVDSIKKYLTQTGLATYSCLTYKQTLNFHLNSKCPQRCDDLTTRNTEVKASDVFSLALTTTIQDHIISKGPAVLALKYGQSFNQYQNGIYTPIDGETEFGIRFLLLVGWSTTSTGEVHWKAVNTFGNQYGQNGRISSDIMDSQFEHELMNQNNPRLPNQKTNISVPLRRELQLKSNYQGFPSPRDSSFNFSPNRRTPLHSFHELMKPFQFYPKPKESPKYKLITQRVHITPIKPEPQFFKLQRLQENTTQSSEYILKFGIRTQRGMQNGTPKINQDSYLTLQNVCKKPYMHYFSVFDGHGSNGHLVSQFIKQQFQFQVLKQQQLLELNPSQYLEQIFSQVNAKLRHSSIDILYSGSTVVSLLMVNNIIYCSNLGDSRAIKIIKKDNKWALIPYSRDHKPSIQEEAERIVNARGRIEAFKDQMGNHTGPLRVWSNQLVPGLAMSRSMGDEVAHSVGVSSIPEIQSFSIDKSDKIILLGSDGLFEFLNDQEIIDCLCQFYEKQQLEKACDYLLKYATSSWNKKSHFVDDITFILIFMTY